MKRVMITGRAAYTCAGNSADATWQSILAGQTGLNEISSWDISSWTHRIGGELKDFEPAKRLPDKKLTKLISRHDAYGIHVAVEAVLQSQMIPYRDSLTCPLEFNNRTGIYVGSPGNKYFQQYDFLPLLAKTKANMQEFARHLFDEVHPMWLLRILPNNVLAYTGITYGFQGANQNITNHAVGGTQALLEAYHAIQNGQIDRAVVVAYDTGIEPQALFYYTQLGLISARHLKPFDFEHDGTLLAEGAGALILESEAHAKARNAVCYGELLGGLSSSEQKGLFSIEDEGEHLTSLIRATLASVNLRPKDIDMIVAHGNGNKKSDITEALAINRLFESEAVPVTAFKWSMGHCLSASGILDAVLSTYALQTRSAPGIANLQAVAPSCKPLEASALPRSLGSKPCCLMLNRGFAGMNASLVIKACE